MDKRHWHITDGMFTLSCAPTELQAWLRLFEWDGECVNGVKFMEAVGHFRGSGHRAVEITEKQEAYERRD